MKLVGLYLCRNEDWVCGLSLCVALRFCDAVIVLDHASTDRTPQILDEIEAEHPGRLIRLREDEPVWYEMAYRQRMLDVGRAAGGTHFAMIDADEVLTGNLAGDIRGAAENLKPGELLELWMPCLWRSINQYRVDRCVWSSVWATTVFRDSPELHWANRNGYDFHHRHPFGSRLTGNRPFGQTGGVMHLQWVVWRRLLAKHAGYRMQEHLRWPGRDTVETLNKRYDLALDETTLRVKDVPLEWWAAWEGLLHHADFTEQEPWQERQVREWIAEHGAERFSGLNLFGIAYHRP